MRQNESNRNRNDGGGGSTALDSNVFDKRHAFKTFSNQFNSSLIAMYKYKSYDLNVHSDCTFNRVAEYIYFFSFIHSFSFCVFVSFYFISLTLFQCFYSRALVVFLFISFSILIFFVVVVVASSPYFFFQLITSIQ